MYCVNPSPKALKEFEINPHLDCIFWVQSGGLMLRNCTATFKSHPKHLKSKLPMIVALPSTFLNLTGCTFIGNETNHNSAVIAVNADLFISETFFQHFKAGAIYSIAKPYNTVIIKDSEIRDASVVGIYLQGEGSTQECLRLKIEYVEGPAIKVCKGNASFIKGCSLVNNKCGIHC